MRNKNFNQFKIGDFAKLEHIITLEDVNKFVELTGDDNPLHVNKNYAKKTVFKDTVVHGMLGASFISTIIGKHIPGNGALWISQNFDFLLPTRIGDQLTILATVIEKHESQRILVLETIITNQHKQQVVKGVGKVKCLELEETLETPISTEDQKVIIIVGGSRGIGAATAEYLANKGYRIVLTYLKDQASAEAVVATIQSNGGEAIACQTDVRNPEAVNAMIEKAIHHFGSISGLVYSATSKMIAADFFDLDWKDIQEHLDVQLQGAFYCAKGVLQEFLVKKRGSVVFIGSIAADATPPLKVAGYATAKAALHAFSKSLALEYGPHGIRFNVVSPGMTETGLIADIPEKTRLFTKMQIPLRRLAQPEDIAATIEFLLSSAARHITGETIRVYGGQLMI